MVGGMHQVGIRRSREWEREGGSTRSLDSHSLECKRKRWKKRADGLVIIQSQLQSQRTKDERRLTRRVRGITGRNPRRAQQNGPGQNRNARDRQEEGERWRRLLACVR